MMNSFKTAGQCLVDTPGAMLADLQSVILTLAGKAGFMVGMTCELWNSLPIH